LDGAVTITHCDSADCVNREIVHLCWACDAYSAEIPSWLTAIRHSNVIPVSRDRTPLVDRPNNVIQERDMTVRSLPKEKYQCKGFWWGTGLCNRGSKRSDSSQRFV